MGTKLRKAKSTKPKQESSDSPDSFFYPQTYKKEDKVKRSDINIRSSTERPIKNTLEKTQSTARDLRREYIEWKENIRQLDRLRNRLSY